jgi:hypothetical protein
MRRCPVKPLNHDPFKLFYEALPAGVAAASLCRHPWLGLHQIADDVGRLDERARREVGVRVK